MDYAGKYWGIVVVLLVAYYGVVVYRLNGRKGGLFLRRSVQDRKMAFSRADFTKNEDLADGVARRRVPDLTGLLGDRSSIWNAAR